MRIKTYLSQRGNDYTAIMVCEHCEHQQVDPVGYFDGNYAHTVIPRMVCGRCRRTSSGNVIDGELSHQMIPYESTQIRAAIDGGADHERSAWGDHV